MPTDRRAPTAQESAAKEAAESRAQIEAVLAEGSLTMLYQPIVRIKDRAMAAYEALARGPAGSPLEPAPALLEAANTHGLTTALDACSHGTAIGDWLAATPPESLTLFLNCEHFRTRTFSDETAVYASARERGLRIVFEMTERGLIEDPAGLIMAVNRARAMGWGVALDEVGADPRALALLPVVDPDIIRLDMDLVRSPSGAMIAEVAHAVSAETERAHSTVIAKGVEKGEHLERAYALGATHVQGWLFGRPEPLPEVFAGPLAPPIGVRAGGPSSSKRDDFLEDLTPAELLADKVPSRIVPRRLLGSLNIELLRHASSLGSSGLVIASVPSWDELDPVETHLITDLASSLGFTGAIGAGVREARIPGLRFGEVGPDHHLASSISLVVLSPQFAGAVISQETDHDGRGGEQRHRAMITHDRALVARCARLILGYIEPATDPEPSLLASDAAALNPPD